MEKKSTSVPSFELSGDKRQVRIVYPSAEKSEWFTTKLDLFSHLVYACNTGKITKATLPESFYQELITLPLVIQEHLDIPEKDFAQLVNAFKESVAFMQMGEIMAQGFFMEDENMPDCHAHIAYKTYLSPCLHTKEEAYNCLCQLAAQYKGMDKKFFLNVKQKIVTSRLKGILSTEVN